MLSREPAYLGCKRVPIALDSRFVYHWELLKKQKPDQRKP